MHTTVFHPETGAVWDCPTKALDHYLSIGWALPAESDEDPATTEPQDADTSTAHEQE